MDVRHPFSRRRFFGGVAAAVGALGLKPASLLGQITRVAPLRDVPALANEIVAGKVRGRVAVDVGQV